MQTALSPVRGIAFNVRMLREQRLAEINDYFCQRLTVLITPEYTNPIPHRYGRFRSVSTSPAPSARISSRSAGLPRWRLSGPPLCRVGPSWLRRSVASRSLEPGYDVPTDYPPAEMGSGQPGQK